MEKKGDREMTQPAGEPTCGSITTSHPVPFSIGAPISQGDGSSCRGQPCYLTGLWFGI